MTDSSQTLNDAPSSCLPLVSRALALVAAGLGILVLCGWWLGIESLRRVAPGLVAMNPVTAIIFIVCAAALLLSDRIHGNSRFVFFACASCVLIVGLLGLASYVGLDLGIDRLLFKAMLNVPGQLPNRMAPNTSLNFVLCGIALSLLAWRTRVAEITSQMLATGVLIVALIALLGYSYKTTALYAVGPFIPMALHTAVAFVLVTIGILASWGQRGWLGWVISSTPGALMIRRMLPSVALILAVLGWLRLRGEQAGFYDATVGVALFVGASMALITALILYTARELDQTDESRRRLMEERDRFFNLCPEMICVAGFDGYFKMLNPAWEAALGWSVEELLSKPYIEFIHPDDREKTDDEAERHFDNEKTIRFENRYLSKDGSSRWFLWTATPLVEMSLVYASARDITDRKKIEALRVEVARHVNHELRTPMASQLLALKMMEGELSPSLDQPKRQMLEIAIHSAEHIVKMVDDLLDVTRSETGKLSVKPVSFDAVALAAAVVGAFEGSARRKELSLALEAAQGLALAYGDPLRVRQIVSNLVDNAFKFTPNGGRITVSLRRSLESPDQLTFCIADTGQGISSEDLKRIFDRLYQTENVAREGTAGLGLGLYICKQLVEVQGGRIWVESEKGKGSSFFFTIPSSAAVSAANLTK
jgi:PAS domain S-box-containing protein